MFWWEVSILKLGIGFSERANQIAVVVPDYSHDEFVVKFGEAHDQSWTFCNRISLNADSINGALFSTKSFSKLESA